MFVLKNALKKNLQHIYSSSLSTVIFLVNVGQEQLILTLPPFLRLFLTGIRVNLIPHSTQDIRGGFSGHYKWLDYRWR